MEFFHEGMRALQDRYEGRAVPDRLAEHRMRRRFTEADKEFIEASPFFFLATSSPDSCDCSFKGGEPGFVRLLDETTLAWPDYDGNRMYRSLGNILTSDQVGLLFIRFDGTLLNGSSRLRINGHAEIDESAEAIAGIAGAKRLVRVKVDYIYPNCPRYIPKLMQEEASVYAPRPDYQPPDPPWKARAIVKDIFDAERDAADTT